MKHILRLGLNIDLPVSGIEDHSISAWDKVKHEKQLKLEEKGSWFILTQTNGESLEIPITSVAYIRRSADDGAKK